MTIVDQTPASLRAASSARGPKAYRPDIDGLRALAVLSVVFYHFDIPPFGGGFVGVDIFFVISGFLITAIVAREMREGRFSLGDFYERRLRRIVPALLVMVLVATVISLFVVLPGDLRPFGTSLMNAALFTSNILFYSLANDYFASDTLSLTPVLHTWSLSVEAQFYLVYPWLLLGLRRRPRAGPVVLGALAVLSFAGSAWGAFHAPSAAFYLLPSRAWELLLGGLVALRPVRPGRGRAMALGQGLAGLGLIALGVLTLSRTTPFPGAAALLPCAGAALILRAGSGDPTGGVSKGLSAPPLALVGRVSYSFYLWHWPILVFFRYGRGDPLGFGERFLLIGLAFALALASWRSVERPFIARRLLSGRRRLFLGAGLATVAVVAVAGLVEQAGQYGFAPRTLPAGVVTLANGQYDVLTGDCGPEDVSIATAPPCRFGAPDTTPTILLWGNSYARMWTPTLDLDAKAHGVAGVALLKSKCLPLLGVDLPGLPNCEAFNRQAIVALRTHPAWRTVILGANWFVAGARLGELDRDLKALRDFGVRVVVVLAPPQPAFVVPRTLAMAALRHEPPPPPIDEALALDAQRDSRDTIERLRQTYGFTVIDPFDRLCDGTSCPLETEGHPVFFDAGHLSVFAATRAAGLFDPVFSP